MNEGKRKKLTHPFKTLFRSQSGDWERRVNFHIFPKRLFLFPVSQSPDWDTITISFSEISLSSVPNQEIGNE